METTNTTTLQDNASSPMPRTYLVAIILAIVLGLQSISNLWNIGRMLLGWDEHLFGGFGAYEYFRIFVWGTLRNIALVTGVVLLLMHKRAGWFLVTSLAAAALVSGMVSNMLYAEYVLDHITQSLASPSLIDSLGLFYSLALLPLVQGALIWMLYHPDTRKALGVDANLCIVSVVVIGVLLAINFVPDIPSLIRYILQA